MKISLRYAIVSIRVKYGQWKLFVTRAFYAKIFQQMTNYPSCSNKRNLKKTKKIENGNRNLNTITKCGKHVKVKDGEVEDKKTMEDFEKEERKT